MKGVIRLRVQKTRKPVVNYGGRGMAFEELLEWVNQAYEGKQIATIEKIPTPISIIRSEGSRIKDAVFSKKSSVDYTGTYRSRPIWYDAKSTQIDTSFPLDFVEEHQVDRLIRHQSNGAICFFLFWFTKLDRYYLMLLPIFLTYWQRRNDGVRGCKSIPVAEFEKNAFLIGKTSRGLLDYLAAVDHIIDAGADNKH
ncbi:Holliday junction resolvase RecU [Paenibacillus abyssi]|uniref:Holliday junction resolvase RecU n=1 Tax=Paenibacillus abyssi TaxID=1340531 RepID=A0A917G179_9BACL|nr:Holliday junction resolvase RecU [Paenibacillus abyssi]GGG17709.1 Holliday junction resolvase RecU [Paenibacillus abyssi]